MPQHLKKSKKRAHLRNGIIEHIATSLERELVLKDLEAPDHLRVNTVSQYVTVSNSKKAKLTWHHCKKPRQ